MNKNTRPFGELFAHAAPIFPVRDLSKSLTFYTEQLGFKADFVWQDPPTYAVLKLGEQVQLHLSQLDQGSPTKIQANGIYVFVHDVDAVYQQYEQNGVTFGSPIGDRDYQMRDFDVKDMDGNVLTFGKGI